MEQQFEFVSGSVLDGEWEKKLAIVMLNYNCGTLSAENVKRLRVLSNEMEIVVVDNCSTDTSVDLLRQYLKDEVHTTLIANDVNQGYAAGNNVGVRYVLTHFSNVECVAIMNPDVVVSDAGTLSRLYDALKQDDALAIVTAQTIINGYVLQPNVSCWVLPNKRDILFRGTLMDRIFCGNNRGNFVVPDRYYSSLRPNDMNVAYIEVAQGCFFVAKVNVLQCLGYLDENTFLYYEEDILGKKAMDAGYKVGVLIDTYIRHNHEQKDNHLVINKMSRVSNMRFFYESKKYYIRNYTSTNAAFHLFAGLYLGADLAIRTLVARIK